MGTPQGKEGYQELSKSILQSILGENQEGKLLINFLNHICSRIQEQILPQIAERFVAWAAALTVDLE